MAIPSSERQRTPLLGMVNGGCVAHDDVPRLDLDAFREAILGAPSRGERVSALFGAPRAGLLSLYVVLSGDDAGMLSCARTELGADEYDSMTPRCPEVHLFEREIAEQWAVVPKGHPRPGSVRYHSSYRSTRAPDGETREPLPGVSRFFQMEGDELHEVAVGPVHAGVIEPGHFRFQCHGEHVFHLDIALGYAHRGIERRLVGGPSKRTIHQMETVAGDTTVGHATAYCQILEAFGAARATARGYALRGIALELERLANHTGDLGALALDVGFVPTAAFCGRLRGDFLNMTALACGSRFGRGWLRPGGVAFDLEPDAIAELERRLEAAARDVASAAELLWTSPGVMARLEDTGRLAQRSAAELGLVGPRRAPAACGATSARPTLLAFFS